MQNPKAGEQRRTHSWNTGFGLHTHQHSDRWTERAIKRKDRKEQASTGGLKEHDTFTRYPQLMSPPVAQQMSTDIILFVSVLLHSALVKKKQSQGWVIKLQKLLLWNNFNFTEIWNITNTNFIEFIPPMFWQTTQKANDSENCHNLCCVIDRWGPKCKSPDCRKCPELQLYCLNS